MPAEAGTRLAGVELGGTKAIAVLARGGQIVDSATFPTTDPEETLGSLRDTLALWHRESPLAGLGIASFGPLQLRPEKAGFGTILSTPKRGWSGAAVGAILSSDLDCPWRIDTDVNGAALGEYRWGAGQGCQTLCYVTIGTGVGGGVLVGGEPVHGAMHPEIGHLRLRRVQGDDFPGACRFHGDCIEGLVSGPALAARFGKSSDEIADANPLWRHVVEDLAELAGAILLTTSTERILFGGGVALARPFLWPMVRERLIDRHGEYLPFLDHRSATEIVQPAGLGAQAGPLGAIALAHAARDGSG